MFEIFLLFLIILSSFQTVRSLNIIYSVIQLLLTYCLIAVLLIYYNLDFFAITYVIVCAGGVGILFLFIIMTLERVLYYRLFNLKDKEERLYLLPLLLILFFPFIGLIYILFIDFFDFDFLYLIGFWDSFRYKEMFGTNFMELGVFLYFKNPHFIWLGGFILFFALIASVFLVLDEKNDKENKKDNENTENKKEN